MTTQSEQRVAQPYLHDLAVAVCAPGVVLSGRDGQVIDGVQGLFWADRRVISRLVVSVDGHLPVAVRHAVVDGSRVRFDGVLRDLGDPGADPTVVVERVRTARPAGMTETLNLISHAREPVRAVLEIAVGADFALMADVKAGGRQQELSARAAPDGWCWQAAGTTVRLRCTPAPALDSPGLLRWDVALHRGERFAITVEVDVADEQDAVVLPARASELRCPSVDSGDARLGALLQRSIADLRALVLADPQEPEDRFLAAGAPWFLTLFGRDALWAARMLLPLGTELAAGTLRALARRQGRWVDYETAQQPGKVLHEIRREETAQGSAAHALQLPPVYYGTVDATPLFISVLHDAWRWGMPPADVAGLLPAVERAMHWLTDFALGPAGFVCYRDESGHGLTNQGWKDSGDSVQFRDGALAAPPIALCEVQAYAVAAARQAAALADAFGRPGADSWREWADDLAERFRKTFWVSDPAGDYPAIALDCDGRRVDTVTSNLGHLLGTGLLDPEEEEAVVARLATADMDCGFGLRTMSAASDGFNPLAYHGGAVWTHDTAIAVLGLTASRTSRAAAVASSLVDGLLAAASGFDYRLPELFGGHSRSEIPVPVPYPAACRPQAWSAAASVAVLRAVLGLDADVPSGILNVRPMRRLPCGRLRVSGLRVAGAELSVDAAADGAVEVQAPAGLRVVVG